MGSPVLARGWDVEKEVRPLFVLTENEGKYGWFGNYFKKVIVFQLPKHVW